MKPLSFFVTATLPLLFCIACNNGTPPKGAPKAADAADAAPVADYDVQRESLAKKSPAGSIRFTAPRVASDAESKSTSTLSRASADSIDLSNEGYAHIEENRFLASRQNPLSTFSIDVDAAAYSNIRRIIRSGVLPPPGAVRIEEMINYFDYDYPQPAGNTPFSVNTEMASCPWNPDHRLLLVGLQGKTIPTETLPPSNLVFLIDVSGSMDEPDKLPLVKTSLKMLTAQLRENDKVAIVVYAGNAGLVLPSTPGASKQKIMEAIDNLEAGGSTAGGAGLELAYKIAAENFVKRGNNRVILSTDGDFNVGPSSDDALVSLIEAKRKTGIFLSVLGFGTGNYQDSKMQQLADKGNGDHYYIDNAQEANKVLVREFGGTLFTIAKDVKIQIEFNPAAVQAYRLIGYEKRLLASEDFNDDRKDAGELGSGHRVTALYEIIPEGVKDTFTTVVDQLKYQHEQAVAQQQNPDEWLTIKLRYKDPDGETSRLISATVTRSNESGQASPNLRFAAAVAEFGLLLRQSPYREASSWKQVEDLARASAGTDKDGYRHEFISLASAAQSLTLAHR
jgi:Ca-activated chloride channel family protein